MSRLAETPEVLETLARPPANQRRRPFLHCSRTRTLGSTASASASATATAASSDERIPSQVHTTDTPYHTTRRYYPPQHAYPILDPPGISGLRQTLARRDLQATGEPRRVEIFLRPPRRGKSPRRGDVEQSSKSRESEQRERKRGGGKGRH
ncbi:hypothetical protein B0A50_08743 [Salinomyces thailandicus]|uniref:Uncharacterized protein n=1 Tax=Salinomyces thailandicus TaxID=706561 RepID=A0A4U0TJ25_9PEZI|nr:hypothetical protein B0A50_08743 [Salinomyces thailandica]